MSFELPVTSCQYCCGEIVGEGPEGEGGGEDVGVGQRTLRKPDGIDRREQRGGNRCGSSEQLAREAVDGQQSGGGDGCDKDSRSQNVVANDVPERSQKDIGQRRMSVGKVRNQRAGAVEVQCGGDVVTALVPVVGQAEQRPVR